ncbi:hypothetical protein DRH27_04065, partial [Candidatus Falkowbacteria bacterium]
MKIKARSKKAIRIIIINCFIIFFILGGFFLFLAGDCVASLPVVSSESGSTPVWYQSIKDYAKRAWKEISENFELLRKRLGSQTMHKTISNSLNKVAYDTATWLGSGGKGQKPLFITEGWGEYLSNVADEAVGEYIERVGREGGFNLCKPGPGVNVKIGLGLIQYQRPKAPACTFSEMTDNWSEELKKGDFLNRFQDMFNPKSSDIGRSLITWSGFVESLRMKELEERIKLEENKGYKDKTGISGKSENPPGFVEERLTGAMDNFIKNCYKYKGNALGEAANVFLCQLALTMFNDFISTMGKDMPKYSSPYSGDYGGLTDYSASP